MRKKPGERLSDAPITHYPMIKKAFVYVPLSFLLLVLQIACTRGRKPDEIHLRIIETTDVHGSIFPYDFLNDRDTKNSLARVHAFVSKERKDNRHEVILLDNGDILQGDPAVYLSNYMDTASIHVCAGAMNFMEYDAATIGNHDIEAGHTVYDKLVNEFHFPWMAANALDTSTGEPYFQPYTLIKRNGLEIAVLGLVTPGIPQWLPPRLYSGISFEDMIKTASFWIKEIEKKEKPDLVIGLFHSGHDYSYGGQLNHEPGNENASLLVAEQVPGFDIIFIGHDHEVFLDSLTNLAGETVYIVDPGSHTRYAGIADVTLKFDQQTNEYVKKISLDLVDVSAFDPDPEFLDHLEHYFQQTRQFVAEKVAILSETLYSREALFGNAAFTDLIHTIQLDLTGADLSFTAPLSFNTVLEAGELTVGDLFKLYRFENFLYSMNLTGKEIRDYLEYSYGQWFNQMKNDSDHLLKFELNDQGEPVTNGPGNTARLNGRYYNFDSAAGINYIVDVSKPAGERITITTFINGAPFEEEKIYNVALNSYRGSGGGGHLTSGAGLTKSELTGRITFSTTRDFRFHMLEWMKDQQVIKPVPSNNWSVIPPEWWEKGKERDSRILFSFAE